MLIDLQKLFKECDEIREKRIVEYRLKIIEEIKKLLRMHCSYEVVKNELFFKENYACNLSEYLTFLSPYEAEFNRLVQQLEKDGIKLEFQKTEKYSYLRKMSWKVNP